MIFYRKLRPFQAITFDLDDTLYNNDIHMPLAESAFLADLYQRFPASAELDNSIWHQFRQEALTENQYLRHDMGQLRRNVLARVFSLLGLSGEKLQQAVEHSFNSFYFHRSNFKVDENVHSLLDGLASRYPLVAITNGNVNVEQIGIKSYFSHVFKASLTQPMKPHRALFELSKQALKLDAQDILHVGDNLHNDVYGALKAGFQSGWFAYDREMILQKESMFLLPHVQLQQLNELLEFDTLNGISNR